MKHVWLVLVLVLAGCSQKGMQQSRERFEWRGVHFGEPLPEELLAEIFAGGLENREFYKGKGDEYLTLEEGEGSFPYRFYLSMVDGKFEGLEITGGFDLIGTLREKYGEPRASDVRSAWEWQFKDGVLSYDPSEGRAEIESATFDAVIKKQIEEKRQKEKELL